MQDEPFDPKVVFPIVVLDEPSDPNVVFPIELYEVPSDPNVVFPIEVYEVPSDPNVVFPIELYEVPSDPNVVFPIEVYEVPGFIGKVCAVSACPKLSNNEIKIVRFNIDEPPSKVMKLTSFNSLIKYRYID